MKTDRVVIIPAYEPDEKLIRLLKEINFKYPEAEIIVVNDGSGEQYADVFDRAKEFARVISHPQNLGKGRALKTGYRYVIEHDICDRIIVTMDADGQHSPSDAETLCWLAEKDENAIILGSRRLDKNTPLRSRVGNAVTRKVFGLVSGVSVYDTQTGLRAFHSSLLPYMMSIAGEKYEYEMNVLMRCARDDIKIVEMPVETIYIDNNSSSHFNTVKDSYRIYKEIVKYSASSLLCFAVDYLFYALFSLATAAMPSAVSLRLANVGARLISATLNYSLNRNFVFKSKTSLAKSAVSYFALAGVILCLNTVFLSLLTEGMSIDRYAAKLLTELVFSAVSWTVQKFIIFKPKKVGE